MRRAGAAAASHPRPRRKKRRSSSIAGGVEREPRRERDYSAPSGPRPSRGPLARLRSLRVRSADCVGFASNPRGFVHTSSPGKQNGVPSGPRSVYWRRERDSNPRDVSVPLISSQGRLASPASLRVAARDYRQIRAFGQADFGLRWALRHSPSVAAARLASALRKAAGLAIAPRFWESPSTEHPLAAGDAAVASLAVSIR